MPIRPKRKLLLASALAFSAASLAFAPALNARTYSAIEVRGAEFIPEENIVAACEVAPEVDYSAADLGLIRDCLMSSGQFRSVQVAGEGDTLVIAVSELNDRPGSVSVGLAYDSRDGVVGNLYFERYNLFPGTFGAIDLQISKESRSLQTYLFTKEAFGGLDFGIDTQLLRTDYDNQGFDSRRALIEPYLGHTFDEGLRVEFGIGYRRDEMTDITPGSSALFANEAGVVDAPYARIGFRYSTNPLEQGASEMVSGVALSVDQYFWGLGTDNRISETRVEAESRFALSERNALLIGFQGGVVNAEGDGSSRAVDRFFIGGADFRGFAPRGIGPKDGDYFVGANNYFVSSIEVQRDIDQILGTPTKIGLFADVGSAWSLDDTLGGAIDDDRKIRSSVGVSMTLEVGSVPVSLYVAKPLDHEATDDEQNFGLSISTSF